MQQRPRYISRLLVPGNGLVKITSGDITRVKRDFVLCLHEVGGLTGQIRNRILKIDAPEAETC